MLIEYWQVNTLFGHTIWPEDKEDMKDWLKTNNTYCLLGWKGSEKLYRDYELFEKDLLNYIKEAKDDQT